MSGAWAADAAPRLFGADGRLDGVSGTAGSRAALRVVTEVSTDPGPLVSRLAARHPLAFLRNGEGIIGLGEALRLEFRGASRIEDAAAAWREVAIAATVTDPVDAPGSGLVAFGSFAFADRSGATSVLIVPSVIMGRRGGVSWITRVNDAAIPELEPQGAAFETSLSPGDVSPEQFTAAVAAAVEQIAAGALQKVVLARDLVGSIPPDADLRQPLGRLAAAYADTFTFAVDGLLGSSPETLVRAHGGTLTARVLAGTSARGADAASDATAAATLSASRKDLGEHDLALRSVLTALEPHASGLVASPHPFALALPNLWHLASDVTGSLGDESSALDLVAALHPTAAVAGSPSDAALALIAELEPLDRARYAGPVGWIDARGDGEWALALRCAQVIGTEVRAHAGAGIVSDSNPARELAETTLKFRPIAEALG